MVNIPLSNILIRQTASNWREAIQIAAQPLLENHAITKEYVSQMIESVDTLGPYIVLMPGFALAHASPGPSVLHTDISIATFREPVRFQSENDPVTVIMCLACTDHNSHIDRLQGIGQRLMENGIIEKMTKCQSSEEIFSLLHDPKGGEM